MGELNIAFWNVANLFESGTVERGPQSPQELDLKLETITRVVKGFWGGKGPDILGLAEVGSEDLLLELSTRIGEYEALWEDAPLPNQTGLGILGRKGKLVAEIQRLAVYRSVPLGRPRCLLASFSLQDKVELLMALNHWKSRMPSGRSPTTSDEDELDRRMTAKWLGKQLALHHRETCVLAIGDFNAEPFESPFMEKPLRCWRFFSSALWSGATPASLYNLSWRYLCEPAYWEDTQTTGYLEARPKTTHDSSPPVIFDQLMVSAGVLRGGRIALRERGMEYCCDQTTGVRSAHGVWRPRRWKFTGTNQAEGASDHFPLLATFEI